jgi:DNA-directed RNA polymerase specialized sigma24 family protein
MFEPGRDSEAAVPRVFATTHWSVVMAAGEGSSESAQRALEALCRAYWFPIYVYVRRKGHGPEDAQDLTQEFFAQFIAKKLHRLADRDKGRFRTFLLATLDHFLAREWNRAHRQKRGGQFTFVSLDQRTSEERYQLEPADHETPEKKFAKQWALTVLQNALAALENDCVASGKDTLFAAIKGFLSDEPDAGLYAAIGEGLGMTEGAVRVAVHRLRRRYGELLRAEVAQTVGSAAEAEDELRHLMKVLRE